MVIMNAAFALALVGVMLQGAATARAVECVNYGNYLGIEGTLATAEGGVFDVAVGNNMRFWRAGAVSL